MMARTEAGEKIRLYFLEMEKKAQTPQSYIEALKSLLAAEEEKLVLKYELEQAQPKVDFFDQVTGSADAIEIGEAAKVLNLGMGRNRLFEVLCQRSVLMSNNVPYQTYIDKGWFRVIEQKYSKPDGSICINLKTMVYQKGLHGISKIITD